MADKVDGEDAPACLHGTPQLQSQSTSLRFPTIDLNTSLDSLLSHSTPTVSEASTIMPTPAPLSTDLEESWASLDISDISHDDDDDDDDTRSVNTDPGSLIELSSVHDTESLAEDESQDEQDVDEEEGDASIFTKEIPRHTDQVGEPDQQDDTEAKPQGTSIPSIDQPWAQQIQQMWSTMEGRRYTKDLLFTLIVMMLGVYIISFSQNLSTRVNGLVGLDNATSVSNKTHSTATVTATSGILITTTSTTTATTNQDVALYDPVLFNQMWHRLTGQPSPKQADDKAARESQVEAKEVPLIKCPEKAESTDLGVLSRWLVSRFDRCRRCDMRGVVQYLKSLPRHKTRIEIRAWHNKVLDFYRDGTANVSGISFPIKKRLHDLIHQSRDLLKNTRWAGEKRLKKLLREQKMRLSHAQNHARHMVAAKKKQRKNRLSFFK